MYCLGVEITIHYQCGKSQVSLRSSIYFVLVGRIVAGIVAGIMK